FFYSTACTLLVVSGRWRMLLGWPHLVSAILAASLCLSWVAAAIAIAGWETFYCTVSQEALARVVPGRYGETYHWDEVLVFPFQVFATNLPWSVFAIWAFRPQFALLWDEPGRRLFAALHSWIWPNLLFWSFFANHAPRHAFPMYPAIGGLATMVWLAWLTGRLHWPIRHFRPAAALVVLLFLWLLIKLVHVHAVIPGRNEVRQPRDKGMQVAAVVPMNATLYVFELKDRDEG